MEKLMLFNQKNLNIDLYKYNNHHWTDWSRPVRKCYNVLVNWFEGLLSIGKAYVFCYILYGSYYMYIILHKVYNGHDNI